MEENMKLNRLLLEEEIGSEIEQLSSFEFGSREYEEAIDSVAKLYRLKLEEDRIIFEHYNNRKEQELKHAQINESVKDRNTKICMAAAELFIPLMFYGIWMQRGFKFEESGTFTSTTFRNLFNRFKPTKK